MIQVHFLKSPLPYTQKFNIIDKEGKKILLYIKDSNIYKQNGEYYGEVLDWNRYDHFVINDDLDYL